MKEEKPALKNIKSIALYIIIIFGYFLLTQVPMLLIAVLSPIFNKGSVIVNTILFITWIVLVGLIIFVTWRYYHKKGDKEKLKIGFKDIGIALGYYVGMLLITMVMTMLMQATYGADTSENQAVLEAMFASGKNIWFVGGMSLTVGVVAPILEELVFRGIPSVTLFKNSPKWFIMFMTSIVFSSVHLSENIISFVMYALMGAMLCHAYFRRGNIIDSMLVHFFNNAIVAVFMFLTFITQK
ncbi:CPBP family intramembrane glutamic endopeptidase [Vagococcus hydrophili]|uniref:CPBP family intramembrane metalloprotease n=1 Tax=Vagococcus hydrophili TaxID=2714947 RepID=A0A6G8AWJ8_9ENTE|nr:type II CAAX endopeptidase family protein [Vagococcus hydrophili]QIL49471.1 CPBP family intramembrane metalloprotease [Vagococcus hydrophili]